MVEISLETKPAFLVCGVKTWISRRHNEEFAEFWRKCDREGLCERLKQASSSPAGNQSRSRLLGVSRVEKDPGNRAFDFYVATETGQLEGMEAFSIPGGEWAIFPGDGEAPQALIQAEMEAFCHWLPKSGYVLDFRPELEVYPEGTCAYVEFWLPLIPKTPGDN